MRISSPLRHVLYLLVPLAVAGVLILLTIESLGLPSLFFFLLAVPPISLVMTLPIDALDLWLRRRTRDPIWLLTDEGRAWKEGADRRDERAARSPRDA